jgi:hypothetical protein
MKARLLAIVLVCVGACVDDDLDKPSSPLDAGAPDGGTTPGQDGGDRTAVVVTTRAAPVASSVGAKTSATWAAFDDGSGAFRPLAAAEAGTYRFAASGPVWAIAIVCATPDDARSTVTVHRRTLATTALDVALDDVCAPAPPAAERTLAGTLTNVPPSTSWLDFGYAREGRGATLAVEGTSARYEIVNVADGTWDLAFGLRDASAGPLTKVVLRRGETIAGDKTFDVDANAAGAFTPAPWPLVVRGAGDCETLDPHLRYAMGGVFGIDVGPQEVPSGGPDAARTYATIPPTMQRDGDRYRGSLD